MTNPGWTDPLDWEASRGPSINDRHGHCIYCGRDNRGHEGEPCDDDCPLYDQAQS